MNSPFKTYFDQVLSLCEFDEDLRKGLLFFMGCSMVNNNANEIMSLHNSENEIQQALNQLVFLYEQPSSTDNHLFELDYQSINNLLYSVNVLYLDHIQPQNKDWKEQLQALQTYSVVEDFVNIFIDKKFTIATNHRVISDFFEKIGAYLSLLQYDDSMSYKAGIAYNKVYQEKDFEGFNFLQATILRIFPPMYRALYKFPLFFIYDPNRLNANHLFSTILQFFYLDTNRTIAKHIHAFHNYLFLKPNSMSLRKEWNFETENRGQMISQLMFNTLSIRNSPLFQFRNEFLGSNDFIYSDLKNQTISQEDFILRLQNLFENYYEINIDDMVHEEYNHAEYLQFLAILFYEVSAHAMLPEKIIN